MDTVLWLLFVACVAMVKGQKAFDYSTELCCSKEVTSNPSRINGCCGNKIFNTSTNVCCNNQVTEKLNGSHICCGGKAYLYKQNQLCCGDKLHTFDDSSTSGKITPYYSYRSKFFCCGDKLINNTEGSLQCCNNTVFDSRKQICCDGKPIDRKRPTDSYQYTNEICCKGTTYFSDKQICCSGTGTILDKPKSGAYCTSYYYQCCGDKILAPNQQCCNGTAFTPNNYYDRKTGYSQNAYCCGDSLVQNSSAEACTYAYDRKTRTTTSYSCPIDKPGLQCCGGCQYNATTHICCSDKLYPQTASRSMSCCGSAAYNTRKEICCNNEVTVPKDKPEQYGCCM